MQLTQEQESVVRATVTGEHVIVEAGAGSGKTSTLVSCAAALPNTKRGLYLSFTKAIVEEAKGRLPRNVRCSTAHSLAYRGINESTSPDLRQARECMGKLSNKSRQSSVDVAAHFGIDPFSFDKDRVLRAEMVARVVLETLQNFRRSDHDEISFRDMPHIHGIDVAQERSMTDRKGPEHRALWDHISIHATKAWADICDPNGFLTYTQNDFLKQYQLSRPQIQADFVFFDEAQDANPVMAAILAQQLDQDNPPQLIIVGDSAQAIYGWNGAVDAIALFKQHYEANNHPYQRCSLSHSWRFGQAVADVANVYLRNIESTSLQLTGNPTIDSRIRLGGAFDERGSITIISRTNAHVIGNLLDNLDIGVPTAIVGGATWTRQQKSLILGLDELRVTDHSRHPDLAGFANWDSFVHYVEEDAEASDLVSTFSLYMTHGADRLIGALDHVSDDESQAQVVLSTGHKAKGREWNHVVIDSDFTNDTPLVQRGDATLSLLYVVATRAQRVLEVGAVVADIVDDEAVAQKLATAWDPPSPLFGVA